MWIQQLPFQTPSESKLLSLGKLPGSVSKAVSGSITGAQFCVTVLVWRQGEEGKGSTTSSLPGLQAHCPAPAIQVSCFEELTVGQIVFNKRRCAIGDEGKNHRAKTNRRRYRGTPVGMGWIESHSGWDQDGGGGGHRGEFSGTHLAGGGPSCDVSHAAPTKTSSFCLSLLVNWLKKSTWF